MRLISALAALFFAGTAGAHPHILATGTYGFDFDDARKLEAIEITWEFDQFYSAFAMDGISRQADGTPDPDEMKALAEGSMDQLSSANWFIDVQGRTAITVEDAQASYDGASLTLRFRARLATPLDPKESPVRFSAYDPEYYTEIRMRGLADIVLDASTGCRAQVDGPSDEAMEMAANKDESDWGALAGSGSLFAYWVTLRCD